MPITIVDLNDDVLERIFTFLDFKDLLAAELCCVRVIIFLFNTEFCDFPEIACGLQNFCVYA